MNMVAIALFIIMAVILIKFKLVCEVTANGEKLGYIADKEQFEQSVSDIIKEEENKSISTIEVTIKYHLTFVDKSEETNEEIVLGKIEQSIEKNNKLEDDVTLEIAKVDVVGNTSAKKIAKVTSKKVTNRGTSSTTKKLVGKNTTKVSSDKAETTVKTNKDTTKSKTSTAKTTSSSSKNKSTKKAVSLNGVQLTVKPVSGIITSRFGSRESIRRRGHSGLDIAAPKGRKIKAAASGTVIFAGYSGGYGKVVKVSHGSGIKTYYAHCSKLYVKKGQKISAGDVIAAVGSTGNSTGNHLHFEVVKNGTSVNPQNYLYK